MEQTDNNKDTFDKRASKDESSPLDTSMDIGTHPWNKGLGRKSYFF